MSKALISAVTIVTFLIATTIEIREAAIATNLQSKVFDAYKMVYYDPLTNEPLKMEVENDARLPLTRLGFRGIPCACQELSCGCCAGINITRLDFNQKACTNFTYNPSEFSLKMEVAMNDNKIYENKISGRNPPPLCMPFPYIPAIDFCVRFYDVSMQNNNLQACIDFETRVVQSPIMVLHFDCLRIGAGGISWVKPENSEDFDGTNADFATPTVEEPEVYDEVNFETSNSVAPIANTGSTPSTEEEDNIGQLKL